MAFVLNREGFRKIIVGLMSSFSWTDDAVYWSVDPNPFIGDQNRGAIELKLFGLEALGVDEHRRALGPGGYLSTDFVTTEIGQRDITIQIYAEAYDKGIEAQEIIDLVRTGIRAEATLQKLNALNLAFQWMTKTTVVPSVRNERALSAATADISLGGIASLVSSVEHNQGWIDTVNGNNVIPGTFTQ